MVEEIFQQFKDWIDSRHEYAKAWKERTGGKVCGYFCTYVPEEILYAAGVLPVRILGKHEPIVGTEPYIFAMYCHVCRSALAEGIKGRCNYLDGIVEGQSCLHMRQAFNAWRLHLPTEWAYWIYVPHMVQTPHAVDLLTNELAGFKKAVEEWTGKKITDEELDRGIQILNKNRELMRKVYEYRKLDDPKLTGLEAMEMVLSSQYVDKEEHSKLLETLLEKLPSRQINRGSSIRLMIVGSENDDRVFMKNVEDLDAIFVIDDHCTGTRYFWNSVIPEKDRLRAIAARYVTRPPCPSKDFPDFNRIKNHILPLAQEYKVKGAILVQNKFCDPHGIEIPPLREALKSIGVDTYPLEFDALVPWGQFRTRVEAFLEQLSGMADLF